MSSNVISCRFKTRIGNLIKLLFIYYVSLCVLNILYFYHHHCTQSQINMKIYFLYQTPQSNNYASYHLPNRINSTYYTYVYVHEVTSKFFQSKTHFHSYASNHINLVYKSNLSKNFNRKHKIPTDFPNYIVLNM